MSVIWHKVWFDLWNNKVRTFLAVLSIAAGVFAIGAVFGMVDQLFSSMDRAHQAIVPAHLSLGLNQRIDRNTADRLKNIKGVEDIELLNEVAVRYKLKPEEEWQAARLIMRDDYEAQKYDKLQLKAGSWPKKANLAIERESSLFFGIDLGDKVIFELDQTDRALPITGKIRHGIIEPPWFGGDAVFFTDAPGMERFNIPAGEFSGLLVRVMPYSAELAREVASEIKDRLGKEGIGVAGTFYQDPQEHFARTFVEGLTLVLQVLAVVSLVMGVILVTNTMTALITQQIHQIGLIKAIGGSTGVILKIYLVTVVSYGLLAFLVALPLGALAAFSLSQWFLNNFNIDTEVFQVSMRAITYQALTAGLIPALAALWPVLTGAFMTVRAAIATYGLGGDYGSNWLDRLVERLGQRFLASPYAIALGNMFRRKGRLILSQVALVRTTRRDPAAAEALYSRLKNLYEDQDMELDESATTAQDRLDATTQINVTTTMLLALAVIVALVGGIGLMGTLSIGVVERTREIGVMRAIGARSRTIMGLLVMEGVLQGLLSWLMAIPLSFILFRPLANALRQVTFFEAILDYQYNVGAVLIWLAIILIISTLASSLPARNATRISVRESLAYL